MVLVLIALVLNLVARPVWSSQEPPGTPKVSETQLSGGGGAGGAETWSGSGSIGHSSPRSRSGVALSIWDDREQRPSKQSPWCWAEEGPDLEVGELGHLGRMRAGGMLLRGLGPPTLIGGTIMVRGRGGVSVCQGLGALGSPSWGVAPPAPRPPALG